MRRIVIFFALVVMVAACSEGADLLVLTEANMNTDVMLDSGDEFRIELGSNVTTGYTWVIADSGLPLGVEFVEESYVASDTDLVGAAGIQSFTFEAIGEGAGVLRLEYLRPFEDPAIPVQVAEYIVHVDGAPWPPASVAPPPPTATATAPDPAPPAVPVSDLFDGDGPRNATLTGFVVWDAASARLCDVLAESYPPQCGWASIVIANPGSLDFEFDETQGVRWTPSAVQLTGMYDGLRFILPDSADTLVPTADDETLIGTFFDFIAMPTESTLSEIPLAPSVSLGLGDEIVHTVEVAELTDPAAWIIERDEFRAWAGPFSVLDFAREPVDVVIGAHPRCAGPPVPPPDGFSAHRRVSIQPTEATSCLEWWTVDFFIDDTGLVDAITLDLFAP